MNALFRPLFIQSFKSSGIYLLIIALILAIGATTALKFSNEQIQDAVTLQAAEMLAADLVITDNYPIENKWREEAKKLIQVTKECFFEGIKYAKAGNHLFDISGAIGRYAEERGYGVVRDLCGHGIGTALHEAPEIPNYEVGRKGVKLRPGMTLAIEPMINIGTYEVDWLDDDWTVVTRDGSLSAHYENTILITEGEPRILSLTCDNE